MNKFFVDLWILWREQMGEIRVHWQYYLLFSLVFPLLLVFGFTRLGNGLDDSFSLLYIISGSIIMSLTNEGVVAMAVKISEMKRDNTLMYYASLPISRFAFVSALILSRFLVILPGMVAPLVLGIVVYDFEIHFNLWLIVLIPLIAISCSIFGLFIGILIDNHNMISLLSNALMLLVLLAAPIFIPFESLPVILQWVSYFIPQTYAATALREAILGNIGIVFYLNMLVLVAVAGASMLFLACFWNWRIH